MACRTGPAYSVVLLDVGETLIGPCESYGAVYARVLGELGLDLPASLLERGIRESSAELARVLPRGADRFAYFPGGEAEFWMRFAMLSLNKATGGDVEPSWAERMLEPLRAAFTEPSAWVVFPDVVPALRRLQDQGCRLAVVSNWDSRLPRILEVLELDGFFDALAVSHLEGFEKPDPALFLRALERLDARPEQALHVGDAPELDLAGAAAAGIDALLVDRRGDLDPAYRPLGDLSELPRIASEGLGGRDA